MNSLLLCGSDLAAGGLRVTIGLYLTARLLGGKGPDRRCLAAAWAGTAAAVCLLSALPLPEWYRPAFEAVWVAVCAVRFQGTDLRMSLYIGIYYEIAMAFGQFLTAAWMGVGFRSEAFLDPGTVRGQIAVWLFLILLSAFMTAFFRSSKRTGQKLSRPASGIAAAGLLAIVTLSEQSVLAIEEDTLYTWTILSVVLLMSVLMFHLNRQYEMERELARLQAEQAGLLERDYAALNQAYTLNAKLYHDVHNHIGVLRQLLLRGKTEEAVQYLEQLQTPVREMTDTMWTGDETIDYLINSKGALAKEQGISYEIQVEFPRHTDLKSADLCAILGNLLDNALEAAGQVPDPDQRFVRLTIRRIHQMLVIKVENRFLRPRSAQEDKTLQTTKKDKNLHGWGLQSVRTAAEKYDGLVQTSAEGDLFCAVVTLSYEGIQPGDIQV